MQTSSKVSYDNWSDWNLGDQIMNIRPVGTYCFCKHHHCHNHHDCVDCEFTESCAHCAHKHHCHPHPPVPCPPHHHCDCHDPHLFPVDMDGDGFVESDMIHKHHEPYIPEPLPEEIGNKEDNTTDTMEISDEVDDTTEYYGSSMVDSIPEEIQPVETSEEIDTILEDNDDMVTTDEDGYHTLTDEIPTDEDNWETSKVMDSNTQEIVEETPVLEPELEDIEPVEESVEEKPTRGRRRVNRGGRRKKEE